MKKSIVTSSNFVFGFCNACERYAAGEASEAIRETPTRDSAAVDPIAVDAVTVGAKAALAAIMSGDIVYAMKTATTYGVNPAVRADLRKLALDA